MLNFIILFNYYNYLNSYCKFDLQQAINRIKETTSKIINITNKLVLPMSSK